MFVFHRSFWTVAAGLATALGVVLLSLVLDAGPDVGMPSAVRSERAHPAESGSFQPAATRDISLAKR